MYNTFIERALDETRVSLSPFYPPEQWPESAGACHLFFRDWLGDMAARPEAYGLPEDRYSPDGDGFERMKWEYLALSKASDPALLNYHALKSKAHSAIRAIYQFLMVIGAQAEWSEAVLAQEQARLNKRIDAGRFLTGLAGLGLTCGAEGITVRVDSPYAGMLPAFHALCAACAADKKKRFMFTRCDFRALGPAYKWTLEDVLHPLDEGERRKLLALDSAMKALKYRRVIEFEGRYAYALKQGVILRVELTGGQYHLYFRWPLYGEATAACFRFLSERDGALASAVQRDLLRCRPDCRPGYGSTGPSNCGARIAVDYDGERFHTCTDAGLPVWGHTDQDFENTRLVAEAIRRVFARG